MAHGIPPLGSLPLDRFCNLVYYWFTRNADSKDLAKFRNRLWVPPVGQVPTARSPWSPQAESSAFGALKAALTKKAPALPSDQAGP